MIKVFSFVVISLLYVGCSSKDISHVNNKKGNHVINIAKSGDFLFYAYLEDGEKLIRVSREKLKAKDDEEIVRVYRDGYYPVYDRKVETCQYTAIGSVSSGDKIFCKSHYVGTDGLENIGGTVANIVMSPLLVLTAMAGSTAVLLKEHFIPKLLKEAIASSSLPRVKDVIFNNPSILLEKKELYVNEVLTNKNNEKVAVSEVNDSEIIVKNNNAMPNPLGKDVFKTIKEEVQKELNEYLSVKDKSVPTKIPKPSIPPMPKLVKSQFESKEVFQKRVQSEMKKRDFMLERLQKNYRADVESRNKIIESIEKEQKNRLKNINSKKIALIKEKFQKYFSPYLDNPRYDAETQSLYADLKLKKFNDYVRKLKFRVGNSKAKEIFNQIKKNRANIYVKLNVKDDKVKLKEVSLNSIYLGMATEKNYQPEKMAVSLQAKKINAIENELQSPNLKDKYQTVAFSYSENGKKLSNYQDDLPSLLSAVPSVSKDSTKWLFVIGVDNYDNTDNVIYSKRSADLFAQVAQKTLGITDRNSYIFTGDKATSGAIEDKLNRMLENIQAGDSIYFFYSGHGIPVPPNRAPYILPKDKLLKYIGKNSFFKLSNIYSLLSDSKASKVIAVMDSCFSGATDGKSVFKGVAGSVLVPKRVTFDHQKMVILTAGRDKQFSNMYPKRGHRLFSYFVMKSLLEGKRSVKDVYNATYPNVKSVSNGFGDLKRQEPTISGNEGLSF
jgi:hypothetical protein